MNITVGTFNLNNLFSRYNFKGEVSAIKEGDTQIDTDVEYTFTDPETYKIRTYKGRLVKGKEETDRQKITERIKRTNVDVLAVQEVEDIDTLKRFVREDLDGLYPYQALIEGNDDRLIDVGILSKLPMGGVTSWQKAVHPDQTDVPVFSRDLLEVEIYNASRKKRLLTVFNNHLKSHFVPWYQDPVEGKRQADLRRRRQAKMVAHIVEARTRPNSRFIILGDMNDPPTSGPLESFSNNTGLNLVNALTNPEETREPKEDDPPPSSTAWTHRYKPSRQPAHYELYDQIWLSPSLANKQTGAWIDRRKNHSGDGSDHDPAWVALKL